MSLQKYLESCKHGGNRLYLSCVILCATFKYTIPTIWVIHTRSNCFYSEWAQSSVFKR